MERPNTDDMKPKRDQDRDLELDKKIEALRRKNEALMKRYKEVEEDRKKAEKEGMALQSRKEKADDLTITISKSTSESRVVVTKLSSVESTPTKGQLEPGSDSGGEHPQQPAEQEQAKQLTITMTGKKGKRVVRERPEKKLDHADVTVDEQARGTETTRRGKPPTTKDAPAQEEVKDGKKESEEQDQVLESQEPENQPPSTDLNIPTSREEHEEYLRWKKEREQIDKERVARHKNAKGQWRRAWDMDKTENMFPGKSPPARDWAPSSRGGRSSRRKTVSDSKGSEKRGKDKATENVLVRSSKAKGKDRLTGRARRWQSHDDDENQQTSNTTLEEFLEELDALTKTDEEEVQHRVAKSSPCPQPASQERSGSPPAVPVDSLRELGKAESSSPRSSEKRVRFSEELIQKQPARASSNTSSPAKTKQGGQKPLLEVCQEKNAPPVAQQLPPEAEPSKDNKQAIPVKDSTVTEQSGCNTNTAELINSNLCVPRKEPGESHPSHTSSSDKAKENGKIV